MTIAIPDYALMPSSLINQYSNLSKTSIFTYLVLSAHANRRRNSEAFPSHSRIATLLGITRSRVQKAIRKLLALNLIIDTGRRVGRGVTVYCVPNVDADPNEYKKQRLLPKSERWGERVQSPNDPNDWTIGPIETEISPPMNRHLVDDVYHPEPTGASSKAGASSTPNIDPNVDPVLSGSHLVNHLVATATKNDSLTENKGYNREETTNNGSSDDFVEDVVVVFSDVISPNLTKSISKQIKGIPKEEAQSLIDEFTHRLKSSSIKNYLAYFASLVSLYKKGQFFPSISQNNEQTSYEDGVNKQRAELIQLEQKQKEEAIKQESINQKKIVSKKLDSLTYVQLVDLRERFKNHINATGSILKNILLKQGFDSPLVNASFESYVLETV
jgi:predicted transcriptional regulator